jgi:cellulose synthase (UDP-forming)
VNGESFYFRPFEQRRPPAPLAMSALRESAWHFLATVNIVFGGWYIGWRWLHSINYDALWLSLPLVLAETASFVGLGLFTFNLWHQEDTPVQPPPRMVSEVADYPADIDRPISVDVFFPTYSEDPELVRLSIRDARAMTYPEPIDIRIHVLDDGRREAMRGVAREEGVGYMTRPSNVGFKAGNMRNGLEQTHGDFIVICDADTRPFPTLLEHTLGYFRDRDVAWVQTPQWFFDIPEGERLPRILERRLGRVGAWTGRAVEAVAGPVAIGEDPFENDPQMFYDVILRRRNWANASFCCGAGSVHRREAIMEAALKEFAEAVNAPVERIARAIEDRDLRNDFETAMRRQVAGEIELTPYKFHVSEDIYTSMVLHGDPSRSWKSVFHPHVESKMLSPQDLQTWAVQRFKYAGGTLDIALHDNPLLRAGMSWRQKVMYGATMWSYLGGTWNAVFLFAPIIYLFTGIPPVSTYSFEFMKHIVPFLVTNELAFLIGTWGISNYRGKSSYLAFFPLNLRAIWAVLKGDQIKFPTTPKERQSGDFAQLVQPQTLVILLTVAGMIVYGSALARGQVSNVAGFLVNSFWAVNNALAMCRIVRAAYWRPPEEVMA